MLTLPLKVAHNRFLGRCRLRICGDQRRRFGSGRGLQESLAISIVFSGHRRTVVAMFAVGRYVVVSKDGSKTGRREQDNHGQRRRRWHMLLDEISLFSRRPTPDMMRGLQLDQNRSHGVSIQTS